VTTTDDSPLPIPIMARLRAETRAEHAATEAIPFSASILDGSLTLDEYAAQLAAYLPVHDALEAAVARGAHPALQRVWDAHMGRVDLLRTDLAAIGMAGAPVDARTHAASESFAAWIRGLADERPVALLGVLYVLEGSTLGGALLRKHLATALSLGDDGLRYYSPYGLHPKPHWVEFSARMNDLSLGEADADAVVGAAREAFLRIGLILASIGEARHAGADERVGNQATELAPA
jgi:heme oxygenase (biliverdin-IX-beta and delta-forming)